MRHRSLAQGITVFVAVAMPLFVSLVGLALDAGHLYAVHTDLQALADAAARAGAAQLDTTGGGALRSESGNPPQLDPAAAEAAATAYAVYQGVEPVSVVADVQQVAVQVGQTVWPPDGADGLPTCLAHKLALDRGAPRGPPAGGCHHR